jgi:hypothetical protein
MLEEYIYFLLLIGFKFQLDKRFLLRRKSKKLTVQESPMYVLRELPNLFRNKF